jgi:hypothetical protein
MPDLTAAAGTASANVFLSALESEGLRVTLGPSGRTVQGGTGLHARQVSVSDERVGLVASLPPNDQAAVAAGMAAVLLESARSDAASWSFTDCARTIMPQWHRRSFLIGCEFAGQPAFHAELDDELVVVYLVELTQGVRLLSASQVQDWGAHPSRLDRAAASILYHRTRHDEPLPFEPVVGGIRLHTGDGHDAARAALLEFLAPDADVWIATPDHGTLVWVDATSRGATHALSGWLNAKAGAEPLPLSSRLRRWTRGSLVSGSAPTVS